MIETLFSEWPEHELLDSGSRRKLERFGGVKIARSEPKAWWPPSLPKAEWESADAEYDDKEGRWRLRNSCPREWTMAYGKVRLLARLNDGSKHTGVFPEQSPHWDFIMKSVERHMNRQPKLLNLFGYTGAATLAAAAAGFSVTHVDASKPSIAWARRNQEVSGLLDRPVRWIVDDALKFAKREVRRENRYDAIIMDPPSFGRGPDGQVWKTEEDLPALLAVCEGLLSANPLFIIITIYNIEASPIMLENLLMDIAARNGRRIEKGELALRPASSGKCLPMSIYARLS